LAPLRFEYYVICCSSRNYRCRRGLVRLNYPLYSSNWLTCEQIGPWEAQLQLHRLVDSTTAIFQSTSPSMHLSLLVQLLGQFQFQQIAPRPRPIHRKGFPKVRLLELLLLGWLSLLSSSVEDAALSVIAEITNGYHQLERSIMRPPSILSWLTNHPTAHMQIKNRKTFDRITKFMGTAFRPS
jgi:hypothetical protein